MAPYCSPYPLIPIPDFEPQTKGIVRPNAPQRLSLAAASLMSQRSILFRVRTELGDGEVEDYSQLSEGSEASSMQLVSAQPAPSDGSSSTASAPSSSRPLASSSKEPPSSTLSSASVYSQESYLLASSKHPMSGAVAMTPAVATAASVTLGIPFSVRTPSSAKGRAKPRTPLSSSRPRPRIRNRPRSAKAQVRPRRRGGAKDDDGEEHRRFAMAFSPSVGLPWESLVFGGEEHSPIVNLEIGGLRASRGYPEEDEGFGDEEVDDTWEDEVASEEDGSTTPKTGDPSLWVKPRKLTPTGDEAIMKGSPVPVGTRRRPVSIIRGKLRAKRGQQRTPSEAASLGSALHSPMPASATSQASPASSIIINNLPTFTPLRRALSRMTAQSAVRNEKADLPTGLRRTKSQLLSPIADADVEADAQGGGMSLDALSLGLSLNTLNLGNLKDSLAQYWSPAIGTPAPAEEVVGAKGPVEDAKKPLAEKELPSTPRSSPSTGEAQTFPRPPIVSTALKSRTPPSAQESVASAQRPVSVPASALTRPISFPAPPPIPESPYHAPPLSPASAPRLRKAHKRYLSSPALLNFRPSELPLPPPPMPDLKDVLAQLGLAEGKSGVADLPARTRVTVAATGEKKQKSEKKAMRNTFAAKRRTVGSKDRVVERVGIRKEMIGVPVPVPKRGPGSS